MESLDALCQAVLDLEKAERMKADTPGRSSAKSSQGESSKSHKQNHNRGRNGNPSNGKPTAKSSNLLSITSQENGVRKVAKQGRGGRSNQQTRGNSKHVSFQGPSQTQVPQQFWGPLLNSVPTSFKEARMRAGECMYCGKQGHKIPQCQKAYRSLQEDGSI